MKNVAKKGMPQATKFLMGDAKPAVAAQAKGNKLSMNPKPAPMTSKTTGAKPLGVPKKPASTGTQNAGNAGANLGGGMKLGNHYSNS